MGNIMIYIHQNKRGTALPVFHGMGNGFFFHGSYVPGSKMVGANCVGTVIGIYTMWVKQGHVYHA